MAAKNIRKCRYYKCEINDCLIDTSVDDYVIDNKRYYHRECFEKKKRGAEKTEKERQLYSNFVDLWHDRIDVNVDYARLADEYNRLLKKKEDPEYLFFALEYCINNRLNLHYPAGFHYFSERQDIRDAYARKKIAEMKKSAQPPIPVKEEPKFTVKPIKPVGFGSIFGKR